MSRRLITVIGVVVAALATAGTGGPAPTLKGPGIVRITSVPRTFARVDIGRPGYSAGDMKISRVGLFNRRVRKRPLGNGQLVCIATGQKFWNCNGTYILPAGKLMVSGVLVYSDIYDMAVVGGSGTYNNVHGTLVVTRIRRNEKLMVFRLTV
ncbi:MAG: hypothetical protein ACJ74D_01130 [Gaiellaceae bacterium]